MSLGYGKFPKPNRCRELFCPVQLELNIILIKLYIMKYTYWLIAILLLVSATSLAQGPPITADKPIMLGGGSFTIKTLMEFTQNGTG